MRWRGDEYESAEWFDRWAIARQALDGSGDLVLEDETTGERRVARRYRRRSYGEIRGVASTPLDKLIAEAAETPDVDLYAPAGRGPRIVPLPGRTAPAAELDNPLDASRCANLDEAMALFSEIYPWRLSPENRALVVERVEENGLKRDDIVELAQELASIQDVRRELRTCWSTASSGSRPIRGRVSTWIPATRSACRT